MVYRLKLNCFRAKKRKFELNSPNIRFAKWTAEINGKFNFAVEFFHIYKPGKSSCVF